MHLLICGDRNWSNLTLIRLQLELRYPDVDLVISGHARGADSLGERAAEILGIPIMIFPAQWDIYGKAAGPIRNQQMLDEGKPDEVWAFHDFLLDSKGTKDMCRRALRVGIPVLHYQSDGTVGCLMII